MFIDCHLHTRIKDGLPRNDEGDNYATPAELIAMMDRTGVDKGILLPGVNPECHQQITPTEDMLEVVDKHPERFIAFCNVDPRAEDNTPDANLSRPLLYYKKRGCKGVGEICANMYFDDPYVLNLFKHCAECEMPVLFHVSPRIGVTYGLVDEVGFPRLEKCLKQFPALIFIGHSQLFWASISGDITKAEWKNSYPAGKIAAAGAVIRLLDAYPNLYGDISAGSGYNALVRDAEFGYHFMEKYQDRLLFGTDICSPKNDHRHAEYLKNALKQKKISEKTFEKISWRNVNRILKLGL